MPTFLERHYAAKTVEEINEVYDAWASTYDTELSAQRYAGARSVASVAADIIADRDTRILDVGCGTGLVGRHLADAGFTRIDGIDLSDGMLSEARAKQCYTELIRVDLLKPLALAPGSYDAIASAGVFTASLLGPDVLVRVCELVRPGGRAVIGVNVEAFESQGYLRTLEALIDGRGGALVELRDMPYWPEKGVASRVLVIDL